MLCFDNQWLCTDSQSLAFHISPSSLRDEEKSLLYLDNDETDLSPIMQFTGLLDKNGKEIWEGDVVDYIEEYIQEDLIKRSKGIVEYVGSSFTIDGRGSVEEWEPVEVVGNLYENPNLLAEG